MSLVDSLVDLIGQILCKGSNFHCTFVTFALFSYRYFVVLCFFFAHDEHVGYAFELVVADFFAYLLVAVIDDGADVGGAQAIGDIVCIVVEFL